MANFLGNHKSADYVYIMRQCVEGYRLMGCNMSHKIHLLDSRIGLVPENLDAMSDEHGDRFHQDNSVMEYRYQG